MLLMASVYLDTTIPSYYFEERKEIIIQARKEITVSWWNLAKLKYDLYISAFVLAELDSGDYPQKDSALGLIQDIPVLEATKEVQEIVEVYVMNKLMPNDLVGDAAHLAIASWHKIDYLVTWNLQHLANVNKVQHIRMLNNKLRLFTPEIVTPEYFSEESV